MQVNVDGESNRECVCVRLWGEFENLFIYFIISGKPDRSSLRRTICVMTREQNFQPCCTKKNIENYWQNKWLIVGSVW